VFLRFPLVVGLAASLTLVSAVSVFAEADVAKEIPLFSSIQQVRHASPSEVGLSVRIRGQVLVLSGWKDSFFVSDGHAGISVDRYTSAPALQPGDLVEINGRTGPGLFAPIVVADNVRLLGHDSLPSAPNREYSDLIGGGEDSQWVEIRGIVQSAWISPSWGRPVLFLNVAMRGGNVSVRVHDFSIADASYLVDSEVRIRGVCGTNFNDRRQFIGLRLFVRNLDDVVVEKAGPDISQLPLQSPGNLLDFKPGVQAGHRVRIRGTVTLQTPGTSLYVQDGDAGLYLQTAQSTPVAAGAIVDAAGFVETGSYSPELKAVVFRVVGSGTPPAPTKVQASEVIRSYDGFLTAPFDARLVTMQGTVVEHISKTNEEILSLRDGDLLFRAYLHGANARQVSGWNDGDRLELTGVISIQSDESREPRSFELNLRTPADVVVVRTPPWWDLRHSLFVLGMITVVAMIFLLATLLLRRQVRWQARLLAQEAEKFRLLVAGIKDYAIFTLDPQGNIATWNEGAERIYGYRSRESIGAHISKLYSPEALAKDEPAEELRIASDLGQHTAEGWRVRKDGSQFWASILTCAVRDAQGKLIGFSKVARDITERRRVEEEMRLNQLLELKIKERTAELLEANRELEAFTYTAAHDLRAPLRHIQWFTRTLQESFFDKLDEEGRRCLGKIMDAAKAMGMLLDDLLNFSHLGKLEMEKTKVDLGQIVRQVREKLEPDLKGRTVIWEVATLPEVEGDPSLLYEVVFNLLSNAVKYTERREKARIEIGSRSEDENNVSIFVRDNGAGFEPEYAHKLFKVFQRLHSAKDFAGTGIGLAIVRRIVERHGGKVSAIGKPGEGAIFTISLQARTHDHGKARLHTLSR
jgi:PAS domain S-box-containing protein